MYKIKEIYFTLQGEGFQTGRPSIFIRFSGCNLWSGMEKDRNSAICNWCDTDFVGTDGPNGGKYSVTQIKKILLKLWPDKNLEKPYVVCTGGEPLLQLDEELIKLNALPIGITTQTINYIKEMTDRLVIPYDILSDSDNILLNSLKMPHFQIENQIYFKRLTLIVEKNIVKKVFYPIFPPNKHINEVLQWLKEN